MQESRLFRLIYLLLEQGQVTATELARKLEVSVRTIYRDIDALSAAGIPIYAQTGRSGGVRLMRGFVLNNAVLSQAEKQEILSALQSLHAVKPDSSETIQKLSAVFHLPAEDWIEVDFSRWDHPSHDNEKFERLKSAILHRNVIQILYAGSYQTVGERTVYPLKLAYKAKAWYLKAFCTNKQDFRMFKLHRILNLHVSHEHFGPLTFPEQAQTPDHAYAPITLAFPQEMAYRVYDEFDQAQVERRENGDLIVCARMPQDAWLIGFLLSFGTQVEIIEPAYLKAVVAKQAMQIYEKNKP